MKLRTFRAGGYKEFDEGLVKYKDENEEWTWDFTLLYTKPQHMIWEIKGKEYRRLKHSNFSTIKKYVEECKNKGEKASLNGYVKTHPVSAQWNYYQIDSNGNFKLISTSVPDNTYVHELRNAVIEGLIKLADKDYLKNFNNTPITGNTKDTKAIYDAGKDEKFQYIRSKDWSNSAKKKNLDYIDANGYTFVGPYSFNCPGTSEINSISINYNDNKTVELSANNPTSKDFKIIFELSESSPEDYEFTYDKNGMLNIKPINVAYYQEFNEYKNIDNKDFNENGTFKTYDEKGNKFNKKFYLLVNKNSSAYKINNIKIGLKYQTIEITEVELQKINITQQPICNDVKFDTQGSNIPFDREINLIPPVNLTLNKVNSLDLEGDELYNIPNIPFNIKFEQDGKQIYNKDVTTGKDGKVKIEKVIPNSRNDITVTITEKKDIDGDGYKVLSEPLVITLQCSDDGTYWKEKDGAGKLSGGEKYVVNYNTNATIGLTVKLENKSIIEKLTLSKTSSVGGEKVEGAKFKLTLTNIASIKGYKIPTTGTPTIIVTTDKNGNIVLEDIEIADLSKDIVITMEETEAPVGYKKIEGKITVTLKRKGNTYTIHKAEKEDTVTEDEFKAGEVTLINHELVLNIKDIPIMNLGGIVWTEKIKTDKTTAETNNQYDGENQDEALAGIKVNLYKDGKKVTDTTSSDGNKKAIYTDHKGNKVEVDLAKGEYMFTDITAGDDYYVVFEYDGIKYQAMTNSEEQAYKMPKKGEKQIRDTKISKETNRDNFNKNTETISGNGKVDESKTNAGWIIEYDLDNDSTPNKAIYKDVKNENGELQYVEGKTYTYLSKTEDWMGTWNTDGTINKSHYAFNINCGLSKRFFDLSLGTDVKEATVAINGNQTTYTYDQILDGKLDEALNRPSSEKNIDYNLYLAVSDYNYRIDDYKVPEEGAIENKYDVEALNKEQIDSAKKDSELKVYVTYKIELKNQSTQHDAKVNLVEYHFDEHYQYVSIKNATAEKDPNARVLYITPDERIEAGRTLLPNIEITFEVLPDKNGNKCVLGEDYLNQAEIISYTTGGGLVDEDSAPGNAFLDQNNVRYEDDTDEANGIQINRKENKERSISGKVFDTENNNSVNNVIVQLIELVEINNKQYEYIWQETVAGSNTVKTTARNGYVGESYSFGDDDRNNAGEYKFTQGIIPGNYIVRFIYGDGSTYDITENTLTYNGEDYKSTYVDYDYNAPWYNNTSLNGEKSKAVDNEARRLKVMSYAVDVNGKKGAELALLSKPIGTDDDTLKDVLANTWMCAETLKIKMPVDTDIKENVSNDSTVGNGNDPIIENTQFNNVNFGLMERPKTKLVLEKHITGLTIKPVASGVNLIANATADINKILEQGEGNAIQLEGQQDGLFAQKSGRTNRGQWYLQTDTTELAQGADAYITYTYVIKNEGDEDYLNEDLIALYENDINGYVNKLSDLETEVKNAKKQATAYTNGTYISNFYYTGHATGKDKKVLASVEQIQEALNPKVTFVNSTTDFSKTDNNSTSYYDKNGILQPANIKETITSTKGTDKLLSGYMDLNKKLVVSVGLSASEIENGGVYDSYIAQVTHYTNAAGRRDQSTPANLSYVHSEDTRITLDSKNPDTNKKYNEQDEFWAETFKITKPTGEDKMAPVQIAIITISAVAVLGVGIILIKKFVLKK